MALDPITVCLDKLWAMLEGNSGFAALVKVGNRIKYQTADATKREVGTADLPEVRIVPTTDVATLPITSNGTQLLQTFEIQIATGSKLLKDVRAGASPYLFQLRWEIYRAIADWQTYLGPLAELKWGDADVPFKVTNVRLAGSADGVLNSDLNRGIKGWSSLTRVVVEMFLGTQAMKPS